MTLKHCFYFRLPVPSTESEGCDFSTSTSTNWGQRPSKTQTATSLKNKKVIQTLNFQRILGFIYQFQRFHLNYLTPWEATTEQTNR